LSDLASIHDKAGKLPVLNVDFALESMKEDEKKKL
jgi:hypothetical protein